jgi:hypothetical protein
MKNLSGQEITSVNPHYEHICVHADGKTFFITSKQLVTILSEFEFQVEKKRTRSWLHLDIEYWRIEEFDKPRTY